MGDAFQVVPSLTFFLSICDGDDVHPHLLHYCRFNGCVYISNEYENEVNERRIYKNILDGVVKMKFTESS